MQARQIALAAVCLVVCSSASALNKCVDGNGKVSYQEQPCARSDRAAVIRVPPTEEELNRIAREKKAAESWDKERKAEEAARAQRAAQKDADEREMRERIEKISRETDRKFREAEAACGKPIHEAPAVGMPEGRFLKCTAIGLFGKYRVNETQTAAGVTRQYVYDADDLSSMGMRYVHVRNGVVSALQR